MFFHANFFHVHCKCFENILNLNQIFHHWLFCNNGIDFLFHFVSSASNDTKFHGFEWNKISDHDTNIVLVKKILN